jgi:hypothetical protein
LRHFEKRAPGRCDETRRFRVVARGTFDAHSLGQTMLTPGEPTRRHQASHAARGEADGTRPTNEQAPQIGKSLALLGVMLLFLAALLAAERRELQGWRQRSRQEASTLATSDPAASPASASSTADAALAAIDAQGIATNALERALFVALIGVALAASTVVLRRGNGWFIAVTLVLACLVISSHQFTVAHEQLSQAQSPSR